MGNALIRFLYNSDSIGPQSVPSATLGVSALALDISLFDITSQVCFTVASASYFAAYANHLELTISVILFFKLPRQEA